MTEWSRRAVCGALVSTAATGVAACWPSTGAQGVAPARPAGPPAALVLYQGSLSARTPQLVRNAAHVDSLPFDGITVNVPASWAVMEPGARLDYREVHDKWLAPLRGRFERVTRNFVLAMARKAADPFDDWTQVIENWKVLARAARDAGLIGIMFDNEAYYEPLWRWPEDLDHRYPLAAYQRRYRERGRELMRALRAVWPEIRLVALHGPYLSEPRTPGNVTMRQAAADERDLSGHFFVGLVQGSAGEGQVVDGGEVYQYRTTEDFARSYAWRKREIAALRPGGVVPDQLRAEWPRRVSVGFGAYDMAWKEGYPMDPSILARTLAAALAQADDYVWLFTESGGPQDYLTPGGADAEWLDAIRQARRAAAAAVTPRRRGVRRA